MKRAERSVGTTSAADIERMCQEALARGVDPDELARARAVVLKACGGDMERMARAWRIRELLQAFEAEIAKPPHEC